MKTVIFRGPHKNLVICGKNFKKDLPTPVLDDVAEKLEGHGWFELIDKPKRKRRTKEEIEAEAEAKAEVNENAA
jgi:hypothetical protein